MLEDKQKYEDFAQAETQKTLNQMRMSISRRATMKKKQSQKNKCDECAQMKKKMEEQ